MRLIRSIRAFAFARALVAVVAAAASFTAASAPASADAPDQLQFTATSLDGGKISGATYAGKPAVFWFWTPWCPYCNQEGSFVQKVASGHPNVPFVGVASRSDQDAMRDFVNRYGLKFPQIEDSSGEIWGKFGVNWQPAFAFISSNGEVDMVKFGDLLTEDQLNDRVGALR